MRLGVVCIVLSIGSFVAFQVIMGWLILARFSFLDTAAAAAGLWCLAIRFRFEERRAFPVVLDSKVSGACAIRCGDIGDGHLGRLVYRCGE